MIINQNQNIAVISGKSELRPYEKCVALGARSLNDAELVAVIIRTGTNGVDSIGLAKNILSLNKQGNGLNGLTGVSIQELKKIKGVGTVKAIQIQCIFELSRRIAKQTACTRLDFSCPEAIARYYMEDLRHLKKEHLVLVMLDTKCRLIRDTIISIGTVNASLITPREIFIDALKYDAVSIVLLHNHPSGDSTPSHNDIIVTKRVKEAGDMLGIQLIDHLIIGDKTYTSLKEKEFM